MIPARRDGTFLSRPAGKLVACLYGQKHCRDETSRIARTYIQNGECKGPIYFDGHYSLFFVCFSNVWCVSCFARVCNSTIIMSMLMSRRRYLLIAHHPG